MKIISLLAALATGGGSLACSSVHHRFADAPSVESGDDMRPIPVPEATEYERFSYTVEVLVRRPVVESMQMADETPSHDVNSMDDVPESAWFEHRLGYRTITPEELLEGPADVGPPEAPITVVKAKKGGANPGFIIEDARGKRYLMKFDPPNFPAIETTTALIANRMFWGFGYYVPEDYLYVFKGDALRVDSDGDLTQEDVNDVLGQVAVSADGSYRSTVSLLLDGIVLGPLAAKGVREGDSNDRIPHQNRRTLRALHVFAAFLNHTDIRVDNSLDVYVGEPGRGFVKHYLLDFGEAFGGHGAEHDFLWDGYSSYFGFSDFFRNFVTVGLVVEDWENIQYTRYKSVGAFEADVFELSRWDMPKPYEPIIRAQPSDDYWAAKILGGLTHDHIRVLVEAADYPEAGAADYVIDTVIERRRKVLLAALTAVSPVDAQGLSNGTLELRDMGRILLPEIASDTRYEVRFYNGDDRELGEKQMIPGGADEFSVSISDSLMAEADGYLRVDVWVWRGDEKAPTPAEFHLRGTSQPRLVGVVH